MQIKAAPVSLYMVEFFFVVIIEMSFEPVLFNKEL